MAPCGWMQGDNGQPSFSGSTPSTTQMFINQINNAVLCNSNGWAGAVGYIADQTQMRVANFNTGAFCQPSHRGYYAVSGRRLHVAVCVHRERYRRNDPDDPCHVASTVTDCYMYLVGTEASAPSSSADNSVGLVC